MRSWDELLDLLPPTEAACCRGVLDDERFKRWPASISKHHAWVGGLDTHTREVANLALDIAMRSIDQGKPISKHVVIVSAVFHDFGKVDDYEETAAVGASTPVFKKTANYALVHHVVRSSDHFLKMVESPLSKGDLDRNLVRDVQHCILAHHGRLEYGSPVVPVTREAWAVHLADMASVHCIEERKPE